MTARIALAALLVLVIAGCREYADASDGTSGIEEPGGTATPGQAMAGNDGGGEEEASGAPAAPETNPTYRGGLTAPAPEFVAFLQEHLGERVELDVSFGAGVPYDYRGGSGLSLWYATETGAERTVGVFFECEGSFDRRTGYAAEGTVEGTWDITELRRLGGDPHYTLRCVA